MKKILLAIAGVCLAATSFAQSHFSAGYQNTSTKDGDDRIPFNGIYAGGGYDFAIGKTGLVLTPGIYYSYGLYSKKESVTDSSKPVDVITTSKTKWKEHAIDIPVRVGYGYDITPNARIFAFAGPVFNIGLYSKSNSVVTVDGLKTRDITYDYYDKDAENANLKHFDVKLGFGVGVDLYRNFRIKAGYDWGLVNRYDGEGGDPMHFNVFHVGLAYIFL